VALFPLQTKIAWQPFVANISGEPAKQPKSVSEVQGLLACEIIDVTLTLLHV
jgi:hypothetical protein